MNMAAAKTDKGKVALITGITGQVSFPQWNSRAKQRVWLNCRLFDNLKLCWHSIGGHNVLRTSLNTTILINLQLTNSSKAVDVLIFQKPNIYGWGYVSSDVMWLVDKARSFRKGIIFTPKLKSSFKGLQYIDLFFPLILDDRDLSRLQS